MVNRPIEELRSHLTDLLDNHFVGHSNLIDLNQLVTCMREKHGFQGTTQQIVECLATMSDLELTERNEPFSDEVTEYVCDLRTNRERIQATVIGRNRKNDRV